MLSSFLRKLTGRPQPSSVQNVTDRFLYLFREHGVIDSQIPLLLPEVGLDDLQSSSRLLSVLTPPVLDKAASLFGVRTAWLRGVDDQIYEYLAIYKEPRRLLSHLSNLVGRCGKDTSFGTPLRILTTSMSLDKGSGLSPMLLPVLVEEVGSVDDEPVYRFHIYRDGYTWDHSLGRIMLKAIAHIALTKWGLTTPLFEVSHEAMDEIVEGRRIPWESLDRCLISNPSLEDFIMTPEGSGVAKETEELPAVLAYVAANHLEDVAPYRREGNDVVTELQEAETAVASVSENAVRAAQASHASTNALKARFLEYFEASGKNHPTKKAAAEHFFDERLDQKERLQFANKESAMRAFLEALRALNKVAR